MLFHETAKSSLLFIFRKTLYWQSDDGPMHVLGIHSSLPENQSVKILFIDINHMSACMTCPHGNVNVNMRDWSGVVMA